MKAAGDAAELRQYLAQQQKDKASLETDLALAHRAIQDLRAESLNWTEKAEQLEELLSAKQEAKGLQVAVRLLTDEVQQLRGVETRLQDSELARQRLSNMLQEAKTEALSFSALQQRAAEVRVNWGDAKYAIAELKARNAELEEKVKGLQHCKLESSDEEYAAESEASSPSPISGDKDQAAPTIYHTAPTCYTVPPTRKKGHVMLTTCFVIHKHQQSNNAMKLD